MDCTVKSPALQQLLQACPVPGLAACLSSVERDFGEHAGDFSALVEKYEVFVKPSLQAAEKLQALVRAAVELASAEAPHWDKIAARLRYLGLRASCQRMKRGAASRISWPSCTI